MLKMIKTNNEDWTQLQFMYEACDISDMFPSGVKVIY